MSVARIRVLVAGLLLAGWLGWLAYLAATKTNPVVVSRSQVMAATHFVLADVVVEPATGQPERKVRVIEDLRPLGDSLTGQEIEVRNLREARIGGGTEAFADPGPYLLMLTRTDHGFDLAPPPRAPGSDSPFRPRPWAYRWEAAGVQEQFDALVPVR